MGLSSRAARRDLPELGTPYTQSVSWSSKNASCEVQIEVVGAVLVKRFQRMIEEVHARELDLHILVIH